MTKMVMFGQAEFDVAMAQWVDAFGKAVVWFGQIEWFTHYVIRTYSTDSAIKVDQRFKQRAEQCVEILTTRLVEHPRVVQSANQFFAEAKRLAKVRNKVLHNPVQIRIIGDKDGIRASHKIIPAGDAAKWTEVSLAEVLKYVADLEALNDRMGYLYNHTEHLLNRPDQASQ